MRVFALALTLLGVSICVPNQDSGLLLTSFVVAGKEAYFVAPPRMVLTESIEGLEFLSDGRYALIRGVNDKKHNASTLLNSLIQSNPGNEPTSWVKLWDVHADLVRQISPGIVKLLTNDDPYVENDIHWTSQPGVAIMQTIDGARGPRAVVSNSGSKASWNSRIYRINIIDGSVTLVKTHTVSENSTLSLSVSPTRQLIVVQTISRNEPIDRMDLKTTINFSILDFSGKELKSGSSTLKGTAYIFNWTADGNNMVGGSSVRLIQGAKPVRKTLVLNLSTGMINETVETIKFFDDEQIEPALTSVLTATQAQLGDAKKAVYSLWINGSTPSEQNQCFVASGVVEGNHWLSPKLNQVAFVSHGKLFASEILKVDLATFLKAKEIAERQNAMNNAKNVATATVIYAMDYDDVMPPQLGFEDNVMPYVKNRDVMNGFVYSYKGGPLSGLKNPSSTEIGYMPTKDGRCVAYADGSVKFIKNP